MARKVSIHSSKAAEERFTIFWLCALVSPATVLSSNATIHKRRLRLYLLLYQELLVDLDEDCPDFRQIH